MRALFALARALFGRVPICSLAGGLVGTTTGFFYGLAQIATAPVPASWSAVIRAGLWLGAVGWVAVLIILSAWFRYRLLDIALPTFITSFLTALFVVAILHVLQQPAIASLVGLVVGLLVGYLLCLLCRRDKGAFLRGAA